MNLTLPPNLTACLPHAIRQILSPFSSPGVKTMSSRRIAVFGTRNKDLRRRFGDKGILYNSLDDPGAGGLY